MIDNNLKKITENLGIRFPVSELSKNLKISKGVVSEYINNKKRMSENFKELLENFYDIKADDLIKINTNGNRFVEKQKKVPYYETDVTSHITTSFNDVPEVPAFYVDYKPFNDCTAYVNNFGDSMFPKYKNGEKLAVKQIFNLDVISWGETYLVVTNENANDMRTVKDVHYHKDESKIILRASNPKYAGDTVINREDILSMFAVKGKISQNFI